jgi:hypothetical protein
VHVGSLLTRLYEKIVQWNVEDSQDVVIEVFKHMLERKEERTVGYHRFYEFFEELAKGNTEENLEIEERFTGKVNSRKNSEISFCEGQSSDCEYSIEQTSPVQYKVSETEKNLLFEQDEPPYFEKASQNFGFNEVKPPSISTFGCPVDSNSYSIRPQLKIIDLSQKTLSNVFEIGPSKGRKSLKSNQKALQSGKNDRKSLRLRPQELSNQSKDESIMPKGSKRTTHCKDGSVTKDFVAEKENKKDGKVRKSNFSPLFSEPRSRLKSTDKGSLVGFESRSPPIKNSCSNRSPIERTKSNSRKEFSGIKNFSTRENSHVKSAKVETDTYLENNEVVKLIHHLLKREARLELLKYQIILLPEFNLGRIFAFFDKHDKGFWSKEEAKLFLRSMEDGKPRILSKCTLNFFLKGRETINPYKFSSWFYPLSKLFCSKLKSKLETSAPQFIDPMSQHLQDLLYNLFSELFSLIGIKQQYQASIKPHILGALYHLFGFPEDLRPQIIIERVPSLSLFTQESLDHVLDQLVDHQSGLVTWESLSSFLSGAH